MKKEKLYGYIFALLIYLRLISGKKDKIQDSFGEFIRENLHKIYGEDRELLIYQAILLICLYIAFYMVSIRVISIEINNFKAMMAYKSKNIIQLYIRGVYFFGKKILSDSLVLMIIMSMCYMFITKDYDITNYIYGLLDLIKLPIIMILVIFIDVVFKVNKIVVFSISYFSILMYVFFLNKVSLISICFGSIGVLIVISIKVQLHSKEEV